MKLKSLVVGPVGTNCYIMSNDAKECIVVDPGEEAGRIAAYIKSEDLSVCGILLTHGHFDHITAVNELRDMFGCAVYAGSDEEKMLNDAALNSCGFGMGAPVVVKDVNYLSDEEVVELAGFSIRTLFTPGHTPGGVCFYIEKEGILFSGDTLFCMSVGRTDFPGGSSSTLIRSIKEKLLPLPDDTKVYTGHGEATDIGFEKQNNYFL
ncbi:MAG: MBL fold metallo-hydrolase [Lachnospiraceae bacterium]|nr:MBL fold metallo-hydrolase [Lachnospiraceae bacterium]